MRSKLTYPFAHEYMLQIVNKEGGSGSLARAFEMVNETDILFPLDRAGREFHIRYAAAQQAQTKFYLKLSRLKMLMEPRQLLNVLRYNQNKGHSVALDDLGAGHSTLHLVGELKLDSIHKRHRNLSNTVN